MNVMKKVIFDSSALIPASKYAVDGRLICEYLAESVEIHIPAAVQNETVVQPEKFAGEAALQKLIAQEKIIVATIRPADSAMELLARYKLGLGEQEAILLYLQNEDKFDGIILDDYVAAIVCRRLQIGAMLLLDLIVQLAREHLLPRDLAVAMIAQIAPRYNRGFIEHSLHMLGEPKIAVAPPPIFVKEDFDRYLAGKFPGAHEADWRQRLAETYRDYSAGVISLGGLAQQLRLSVREIDRLFDEIKLPASTGSSELVELWEPQHASSRWLKLAKTSQRE
jgi:predicted nucleic acid-binding protein